MNVGQDLLHKLDALLNKHRVPRDTAGNGTADIPVLTDIVTIPAVPPSIAAGDVEPSLPAPGPSTTPALTAASLSDAEVEALARDIFHRVMAGLSAQISSDLRNHLTERLSSIIDDTVAAAIADFKQELANTVGDAIAEALLDRAERGTTAPPPDMSEHAQD